MSEPPRVDEADVERLAAQVGLTIDPASRAAVAANLAALLAAARLVAEFPLPEETEPAPRFEP
ncbi:MAG: AtzG-like protein [Candidatus Rokuibacteriota bacterium]